MVSVAIATYNGEKYIKDQLDSILEQTVLPDEIIVSDDNSTDNTVKIVEHYKDKYPQIKWIILTTNNNQGYVKNFLKAMKACSNEIIILCDQDDLWKPDKVQKTIEFFSDSKVMSLHNDIDIIDMEGKTIKSNALEYTELKRPVQLSAFFRHLYYCGMSSAFRRGLMEMILSVDPDILPTHDWLVHAAAVCKRGFYTSSEVLSLRRFHGDNVALNLEKTKRKGIQQRIEVVSYYCLHYKLMKELYENYGENKKDLSLVKKVYKTNCDRVNYLKKGSVMKALTNVVNLKYYPTKKSYVSDILYLFKIF